MRSTRPGWERTGLGRQARLLVGAYIGAALVVVSGCGQAPGAPATPPRLLPIASALTNLATAPAWTESLPGPVTVTVAADASAVAGSSPTGAWAYSADGHALALAGASGSAVWALPRERFVVGPGVSDPPGLALLLNGQGQTLWSENAIGPVVAVAQPDGARVAVLDSGASTATELVLSASGAIRQFSLGAGVFAQFDQAGDALIVDAQHAALYAATGGTSRWTQSLTPDTPPRSFALSQNGSGVTVATTGTDNALYEFDVAGFAPGVAWSQALPPGGSNLLVAGPAGRVAVWGLGGPTTIGTYRQQDGTRLWEDTIPSGSGGATDSEVTAVAFTGDGGLAVAVSGCFGPGGPCVLLLAPDGSPLGEVPMPATSQVTLADDGRAAVAVTPGSSPSASDLIAWYALPTTHAPAIPAGPAGE